MRRCNKKDIGPVLFASEHVNIRGVLQMSHAKPNNISVSQGSAIDDRMKASDWSIVRWKPSDWPLLTCL